MKYEITNDTIDYEGITLFRIKKADTGELGGYIEGESNLSRFGQCWVGHKAVVFGDAQVSGDAQVHDYAVVYGHARIGDKAVIGGDAKVFGYAEVYDSATVTNDAEVYGNAKIYGHAQISGSSEIHGFTKVKDSKLTNCKIDARVVIQGDIHLDGIHVEHCTGHIESR